MSTKKAEIQNLVANARIGEALDLLHKLAVEKNDIELQQNIITIRLRYTKIKQQENLGIVTYTEALRELSFISHTILELLNKTENNNQIVDNKTLEHNENAKKILFLASNPTDTGKLQLEKEFVRVSQSLQDGTENVKLVAEWAITPNDLQIALLKHKPQIVHFSGHGTKEGDQGGGIILQDSNARPKLVSGEALSTLFGIFAQRFKIKLVVLNSCYSEEQAKGIGQFVPYVFGMNTSINDNSAIEFSTGLYRGISADDDIEFAFKLAKNMIQLAGLPGDSIPVMFKDGKMVE